MGRWLGLDPGAKRIGVAISDPTGVAVRALPPLDAAAGRDAVLTQLGGLIDGHAVAGVVVGLPRNMDGGEGPAAAAARKLAEELQAGRPQVKVVLYDERLTTVLAERAMLAADLSRRKRRRAIDGQAAVVLLTGYLSRADRHG